MVIIKPKIVKFMLASILAEVGAITWVKIGRFKEGLSARSLKNKETYAL